MAKSAGNMAPGPVQANARYGWAGRLRLASQSTPDAAHATGSGKYQRANIPLLRVPVLDLMSGTQSIEQQGGKSFADLLNGAASLIEPFGDESHRSDDDHRCDGIGNVLPDLAGSFALIDEVSPELIVGLAAAGLF